MSFTVNMVSASGKFGSFDNNSGRFRPSPSLHAGTTTATPVSALSSFDTSLIDVRQLDAVRSVETGAVKAASTSHGTRLYVDGIEGVEPFPVSTCFHRLCAALGVLTPSDACRVVDLRDDVIRSLQSLSKSAKVYYEYTSAESLGNHVSLVSPLVKSARIELASSDGLGRGGGQIPVGVVGVTDFNQFFNKSNMYSSVMFFSGEGGDEAQFGGDLVSRESFRSRNVRDAGPIPRPADAREQSVSDPNASHGGSNITSGVVRPRRRVVASRSKFNPTGAVVKSYVSSAGVQFNNLNEVFLDAISRDYAQEILEQLFSSWGVEESDPDALKYAEDLVWAFIIATTASNKAAYNKEFDIPHRGKSVVVNFDVFSRILAEGHGVTRRQFARGVADDMHRYIREPENLHLLPLLASRVGCDPQMAALAFDGSTHCTGLTSAEQSFTRLLESRNLFEDGSLLAEGASQRLMQGMSSGPRSIISR